jgi:hypothetical protein
VLTRNQVKACKKPPSPLPVACDETVDKSVLAKNQINDVTLEKYWKLVGVEKARETKSGTVRFEKKMLCC